MIPPPYFMCSKQECEDRVKFGEVSALECTDDSIHVSSTSGRRIDPHLAVSKYRRSAAGSMEQRYPLRTIEQLRFTVEYLGIILADQVPPSNKVHQRPRESLLTTVAFVEDRLRAVQVELVKLQQPSSDLQLLIARCQILILYLTADCPSYEQKFGRTALQTALSSYWEGPTQSRSADDEILSYSCLYQMCQEMLTNQGVAVESMALLSSVIGLYRRHVVKSCSLPMFQWSLALVVQVLLGHWHVVLRNLQASLPSLPADFLVFARCLLAPCLPFIRFKALEVYNASFRKGESVPATNLSRLLQFVTTPVESKVSTNKSTWSDHEDEGDDNADTRDAAAAASVGISAAQAALMFGRSVGLPSDENENLLFKVSPLKAISSSQVLVREDIFVLGSCGADKKLHVDRDGILVPSPDFMRRVLKITNY